MPVTCRRQGDAQGIDVLKQRLPWADLSKFEKNPRVQDFGNLLTVNDLCRYVEQAVSSATRQFGWKQRFRGTA